MVFSKASTSGEWKWGEHRLPKVSNYAYSGVNFASNGAWDSHVNDVCVNGRKKLNQLHSVLSNRDIINLCARRLLLLSVVRPSIEYGSAVWDCNKNQASALEAITLGGVKLLGCSSKTCNEAVRGDILGSLSSRRDRAKLKWCTMKGDRYPQFFDQVWEVKPRRGRQRKM